MFNLTKINAIPYMATIIVKLRGFPVDINMQDNCLDKGKDVREHNSGLAGHKYGDDKRSLASTEQSDC